LRLVELKELVLPCGMSHNLLGGNESRIMRYEITNAVQPDTNTWDSAVAVQTWSNYLLTH
jgi:hypothetical protein